MFKIFMGFEKEVNTNNYKNRLKVRYSSIPY